MTINSMLSMQPRAGRRGCGETWGVDFEPRQVRGAGRTRTRGRLSASRRIETTDLVQKKAGGVLGCASGVLGWASVQSRPSQIKRLQPRTSTRTPEEQALIKHKHHPPNKVNSQTRVYCWPTRERIANIRGCPTRQAETMHAVRPRKVLLACKRMWWSACGFQICGDSMMRLIVVVSPWTSLHQAAVCIVTFFLFTLTTL